MDSDGKRQAGSGAGLRAFLEQGSTSFATRAFPTTRYQLGPPMPERATTLADLNGDGIADIIAPARDANQLNIFLNKQGCGFGDVPRIRIDTSVVAPSRQ